MTLRSHFFIAGAFVLTFPMLGYLVGMSANRASTADVKKVSTAVEEVRVACEAKASREDNVVNVAASITGHLDMAYEEGRGHGKDQSFDAIVLDRCIAYSGEGPDWEYRQRQCNAVAQAWYETFGYKDDSP